MTSGATHPIPSQGGWWNSSSNNLQLLASFIFHLEFFPHYYHAKWVAFTNGSCADDELNSWNGVEPWYCKDKAQKYSEANLEIQDLDNDFLLDARVRRWSAWWKRWCNHGMSLNPSWRNVSFESQIFISVSVNRRRDETHALLMNYAVWNGKHLVFQGKLWNYCILNITLFVDFFFHVMADVPRPCLLACFNLICFDYYYYCGFFFGFFSIMLTFQLKAAVTLSVLVGWT